MNTDEIESSARSYYRKKYSEPLRKGGVFFLIFVCLPILLITAYYGFIASSLYVCESSLSVQSPKETISVGENIAGLIGMGGAGQKDLFVVNEFIHSPTMAMRLQEKHDLKKHFGQSSIDMFSRLSPDATQDGFLDYYKKKVKTRLHTESGLIHLKVYAYDAAYCKAVSQSLFEEAEDFVNAMSGKIQQDFLRFAEEQLAKAEEELKTARNRMTSYQKERNVLDPEQSASNVVAIIGALEQQMAMLEVDLADKTRVLSAESPVVQNLKSRRSALQRQIEQEKSRLTKEQRGGAMTERLADYQEILMQLEFSKKRYEMALQLWETAQPEALRKSRYVLPISAPTSPEEARGLNRLREMAGWALGILMVYMCGALLFFSVRDHIES